MKLTKNTLIEGQIFKKGTEFKIRENYKDTVRDVGSPQEVICPKCGSYMDEWYGVYACPNCGYEQK